MPTSGNFSVNKKGTIAVLLIPLIFALVLLAAYFFIIKKHPAEKTSTGSNLITNLINKVSSPQSTQAEKDGKSLSNGNCKGDEKRKLTHLPMKLEDFSMIIPYGLVVGDHVTPIDHQYFSPTIFHSERDKYEVYAMADANLVEIQPRVKPEYTEYRLVFSMSCKLFYYYDLVTSLTPELMAEIDPNKFNSPVNIPVKAGQLIGRIGGQTLDFAVWDMDVNLKGFIVPDHYKEERWKIHTVDPLEYYSEELKAQALSKYFRTAEPISGKIDYDIDGKLVGNWFLRGSNGYEGLKRQSTEGYSKTHLAIVPNHLDPTVYMISFGNFGGKFKQFAAKPGTPDPTTVGVATGLIKYELFDLFFTKVNGQRWESMTLEKNLKPNLSESSYGCVLFQLQEERILQMENFPNQSCDSISNFTKNASLYER